MATDQKPKYRDPLHAPGERAASLMGSMSLDEKLAQLGSAWARELLDGSAFSAKLAKDRLSNGIGIVTCPGGASLLEPVAIAGYANDLQRFLLESTRLGIPAILADECLSGFMARGAISFPQCIGLASTWDPILVERMTSVIRREMRAVGVHLGLSPVLDVARDPRWGRIEETLGEDPFLASRLGVAYIRGLQGSDLRDGVAATGKHFVGYAASEGGRNSAPVHMGERELAEVFLPPFAAAIDEAELSAVMNGYHEIDGIPCACSERLLTAILRSRMAFKGIVVSDFYSIEMLCTHHRMLVSERAAAKQAIRAGVDIELPTTSCYGAPLAEALREGEIPLELVDRAVARVLELKFRLGLFDYPFVDVASVAEQTDRPSQATLARTMAENSVVLLKNDGGVLPLSANLESIAVIGSNAVSERNLLGDYSYAAGLEYEEHVGALRVPECIRDRDYVTTTVTTILDAIRNRVSSRTKVVCVAGDTREAKGGAPIDEAVRVAREAQVVVLVLGGKSGQVPDATCGEFRDRAKLGLLPHQERLARALTEVPVPLVVVLVDGRPLAIPWLADKAAALLEAWLPGQEGGTAISRILFGDVNPSGKLPVSFPRSDGTTPLTYRHKPSGGSSYCYGDYVDAEVKPLFCFGHGLSYTRFEYSNLRIRPPIVKPEDTIVIRVDLENTGSSPGAEVVQVYARQDGTSATRPLKELVGFAKIQLEPEGKTTVQIELPVHRLRYLGPEMDWNVTGGTKIIMVGSSSEDIRLTGSFEVS